MVARFYKFILLISDKPYEYILIILPSLKKFKLVSGSYLNK